MIYFVFFIFSIKVSNPKNKYIGEDICLVEPNPDRARSYSIYLKNEKKNLFGEISYRLDNSNQYEYTIDIGNRRYRTRSLDLRNRHLTILDMTPSRSSLQPEMLFEVMETFSRVNKKYNMTIYDEQGRYAYLAIVILLILLEQE